MIRKEQSIRHHRPQATPGQLHSQDVLVASSEDSALADAVSKATMGSSSSMRQWSYQFLETITMTSGGTRNSFPPPKLARGIQCFLFGTTLAGPTQPHSCVFRQPSLPRKLTIYSISARPLPCLHFFFSIFFCSFLLLRPSISLGLRLSLTDVDADVCFWVVASSVWVPRWRTTSAPPRPRRSAPCA